MIRIAGCIAIGLGVYMSKMEISYAWSMYKFGVIDFDTYGTYVVWI